jgi:type I restriction enzyme S subunit
MSQEFVKFELPKGWIWTTIGELGMVVSGGTPSTDEPAFWGGEIPWITPADLSNHKDKYISKGQRNITQEGLEFSSAKILSPGSILFSSRAPIGYVVIAQNKITTNQGFKNLIPIKSVNSDYIYYYLKSIKHIAEEMASGTTFLELSATKFGQIQAPLPPVKEQHEIVAKIEELYSELDHAENSLKKAYQQLKVYRQAILKSAFEGNFRSQIKGKWRRCFLSDVYNFIGGGTPSKRNDSYWNGSIKWASVKDIKGTSIVDTNDKITEEGLTNSSAKVAKKDEVILITRINPGKVVIAMSDIAINQDLKIVRPIVDDVDYKFTYYLFLYLENFIVKLAKGTTVSGIRINELNSLQIDFPELDVQMQIVTELEKQETIIKNIENSINNSLKKNELFRQIILQNAFKGRLINYINNESHNDLLGQIKIEKDILLNDLLNDKRNTPKHTVTRKSLLDIIKSEFPDKEFSIDELKSKISLSDKMLKEELYKILEDDKYLQSRFNKENQKRLYKIKL